MPHHASAVLPSTRHPGVDSGATPSMATLATSPARCSLIIDMIIDSVARHTPRQLLKNLNT